MKKIFFLISLFLLFFISIIIAEEENVNALNVILSSTKLNPKVGEETTITLSVDNNLNKEINANMAINIGSGGKITDVISGMDCSGNQCKISKKIPARGREDVTVDLIGTEAADIPVSAQVVYILNGKDYSVDNIEGITIHYSLCGDGICSSSESNKNCCIDCGCGEETKDWGRYVKCNEKKQICEKKFSLFKWFGDLFNWILAVLAIILAILIILWLRKEK